MVPQLVKRHITPIYGIVTLVTLLTVAPGIYLSVAHRNQPAVLQSSTTKTSVVVGDVTPLPTYTNTIRQTQTIACTNECTPPDDICPADNRLIQSCVMGADGCYHWGTYRCGDGTFCQAYTQGTRKYVQCVAPTIGSTSTITATSAPLQAAGAPIGVATAVSATPTSTPATRATASPSPITMIGGTTQKSTATSLVTSEGVTVLTTPVPETITGTITVPRIYTTMAPQSNTVETNTSGGVSRAGENTGIFQGNTGTNPWDNIFNKNATVNFKPQPEKPLTIQDKNLCLQRALGDTRFIQVTEQAQKPTLEEKTRSLSCFATTENVVVEYKAGDLPVGDEACLTQAIGKERYTAIKAQKAQPTAEEIEKGRPCLVKQPTVALEPGPILQVDAKTNQCIMDALGVDKVTKVRLAQLIPSEQDRATAVGCFDKINPVQKAILPAPPEQVAYLPPVDQHIGAGIEKAETAYEQAPSGKKVGTIKLTGKAAPNSTVDVYIFSDPIVVTVKTDANGVWSYTLDRPLDPGNHVSYVVLKNNQGQVVRSDVYRFPVAQAQTTGDIEGGLIIATQNNSPEMFAYLYWVGAAIVIGIFGLCTIVFIQERKHARAALLSVKQRQEMIS